MFDGECTPGMVCVDHFGDEDDASEDVTTPSTEESTASIAFCVSPMAVVQLVEALRVQNRWRATFIPSPTSNHLQAAWITQDNQSYFQATQISITARDAEMNILGAPVSCTDCYFLSFNHYPPGTVTFDCNITVPFFIEAPKLFAFDWYAP